MAATSARSPLAPATILRRGTTARDVRIEILYCGICHSDLHTVRDEWSGFMPTTSPAKKADALRPRAHEVIPIEKINEGYERMLRSDVKYSISIDMASLKAA